MSGFTPPTRLEVMIAGALGNLLLHDGLIDNAYLIVTVRDSEIDGRGGEIVWPIDLFIAPKDGKEFWDCPKYGTKHPAWVFKTSFMSDDPYEMYFYFLTSVRDDIDRYLEHKGIKP